MTESVSTKSRLATQILLLLFCSIARAEMSDDDPNFESEKARRIQLLMQSGCASEYTEYCQSEPVISGRRAVYHCLLQQNISFRCQAFLEQQAPDLVRAAEFKRQN